MKHTCLWLSAALVVLIVIPAAAQMPDPPTIEDQELEEEHIRTKMEHGESHASGMKSELGPVIPAIDAGAYADPRRLSYRSRRPHLFRVFTRHHPFAEISHTAGLSLIDERRESRSSISSQARS